MPVRALRRISRAPLPFAYRRLAPPSSPRSALRRFRSDESGAVTVSYVLWLPFFVALIGLAVDASLTFHTHSRMWDAAREAARSTATGRMSAQEAEASAAARLPRGAEFSVDVDETDPQDVVVTISTLNGDLGLTGMLDMLSDGSLRSVYRMRKEVWNG